MSYAVDLFISEKINRVDRCGATPVNSEFPGCESWVSALGLAAIFQDSPPVANRHFALQFVRRVEVAFAEYSRASEFLHGFITGGRGRLSSYFRALYHFEATISQIYLAYDGARKKLRKNYFIGGDDSDWDRINKIYNVSKHEVAKAEQTLWITNDGIGANGASVDFPEIEDALRSLGRIVQRILNPTPASRGA